MARDYGKQISYDPLWRGPTSSRRVTNTLSLKALLIFLLQIWIIVGIYAFSLNIPNDGLENDQGNSGRNGVNELLEELSKLKYKIIGCIVLGSLISLAYIFMLRWCTKFIVYSVIVFFCSCLLAAFVHQLDVVQKVTDRKQPIIIAVVCLVTLVASLAFTLIYRVKILASCEIIKEATKTALYFPTHFIFPVIAIVLMISAFALTVYISAKLYLHENKKITEVFGVLHFYNWFLFLWVMNFISGLKHMIISTSFSTWYWTMDKKYVPDNTVKLSVNYVARYHLGTVALGSIGITIFKVFKVAVNSILNTERENGATKCITLSFSCFCKDTLKFLNYISRNAYVMTGLHGTDFWTSGKDAFNLIMRNVGMVVVTTEISSLIFCLGMLISMLGSGVICYFTTAKDGYVIGVVVVLCMVLSSTIFSVFKTAVETIFICFLEDLERNDGSVARPYYMSTKLKKLLPRHQL